MTGMSAWQAVGATVLLMAVMFAVLASVMLVSMGLQRLADRLMAQPTHGGRARRTSVRALAVTAPTIDAETVPTPPEHQAPRELEA